MLRSSPKHPFTVPRAAGLCTYIFIHSGPQRCIWPSQTHCAVQANSRSIAKISGGCGARAANLPPLLLHPFSLTAEQWHTEKHRAWGL